MKKKVYVGLFIAICICFVALTAATGETAGNTYFDLKVGGYFPQKGALKEGDPGIGTELAFGYYFHRNIAAEVGAGYFQGQVPVFTSFAGTVSKSDTTYRIYPVTLNLVISERIGKFEPFAKAGVGWYFADIDALFDTQSSSSLGYQVGLGALYGNFGIEGKYVEAKPTLLGSKTDIGGFTSTIFYRFRF